jgi:hypothetical protein
MPAENDCCAVHRVNSLPIESGGICLKTIALFGAGGKIGYRLASNLKGSRFDLRHVELSVAGQKRLKDGLGLDCVSSN